MEYIKSRIFRLLHPGVRIAALFLFFGAPTRAFSQEIQINEDPKVTALVKIWINNNRVNPQVEGWRAQVMAGTDRQQVEDGRNRFRTLYPDVPADWKHEPPYYKLRVGAFRSKQEALVFIAGLTDFPGAYPTRDVGIHPRDFLDP
jgi:SPOR domain